MTPVRHSLTVTADDIGLTKANTDTIVETVKQGGVTHVSLLANGDAVEYASEVLGPLEGQVTVALHANLTVGAPCAPLHEVPLLLTPAGVFRYSPFGLLVRYACATPRKKKALSTQVAAELRAQLMRARTALEANGGVLVEANGHQHVHMIPFVFDVLLALPGITQVRITNEPLFVAPHSWRAYLRPQLVAVFLLRVLSRRNEKRAHQEGVHTNTHFIGLLCSGHMTQESIEAGLAMVLEETGSTVSHTEVLLHPGQACGDEFFPWAHSALERAWHFSPWRTCEHALLLSGTLGAVFDAYETGTLVFKWNALIRIARFIVSGTTSAFVAIALLFMFTEWAGLWYMLSAVLALACALLVSFAMQKHWTFSDHREGVTKRHLGLFLLMNMVSISLNALGLYLLVEYVHMWYVVAEFISALVVAVLTFTVMRFVIFPTTHRQ